jgi:hypothetical protein
MWKRLDSYGMSDPDNNEGHPEDRCALDCRPVDEHRGGRAERRSTVWRHRCAALSRMLG